MRARRLIYTLAACSPLFLLALIGINGYFITFPHTTPEYGEEVGTQILNYRIPVVLAESLDDGKGSPKPELVFAVAESWIAGHNQGLLTEIPPACGYDYGMDGVRSEIDSAKRNLLHHLSRLTLKAHEEGDLETAAQGSIASLKIAAINKYSSPLSINLATKTQSSNIAYLNSIYPELSTDTQQTYENQVAQTTANVKIVIDLYDHYGALEKATIFVAEEQFFNQVNIEDLVHSNGLQLVEQSSNNRQVLLLSGFKMAYEREKRLTQELSEAQKKHQPIKRLVAQN